MNKRLGKLTSAVQALAYFTLGISIQLAEVEPKLAFAAIVTLNIAGCILLLNSL